MSKIQKWAAIILVSVGIGGVLGWQVRGPGKSAPAPTTSSEERVVEKIVVTERRPDGTTIIREENRDRSASTKKVLPAPVRKHAIEAGPRWSYQDLIRGRGKPEVWEAGYYRRIGEGNWWVGIRAASDKSIAVAVRVEI